MGLRRVFRTKRVKLMTVTGKYKIGSILVLYLAHLKLLSFDLSETKIMSNDIYASRKRRTFTRGLTKYRIHCYITELLKLSEMNRNPDVYDKPKFL